MLKRIRFAGLGALALALFLSTGLRTAHAVQIVPSVGLTQSVDGAGSQMTLALALRQSIVPRVQMELQVAHRSESFDFAGQSFKMRTIPVTASVWVSPVPMLYAGGGVGAYPEMVEYGNNLFPTSNQTKFGAHLGAGTRFSLTPLVGLDLQGRYVFLGQQASQLQSGSFDPSFWSVSAGLVLGL